MSKSTSQFVIKSGTGVPSVCSPIEYNPSTKTYKALPIVNDFISVDVGVHGFIVTKTEAMPIPAETVSIGMKKITNGKHKGEMTERFRNVYKEREMADLIKKLNAKVLIIEDLHARPMDGGIQAFSLGKGYGLFLGIANTLGMRVIKVSPNKWKRDLKLTGKDKDAGRLMAIKLFPEYKDQMKRKQDHNLADALLLRYWYENFYKE